MTTDATTTGNPQGCAAVTGSGERHRKRMEFLATLDTLREPERWHLLKTETHDERVALFIVAVNDYGEHAQVTKTLCSMVHQHHQRNAEAVATASTGHRKH